MVHPLVSAFLDMVRVAGQPPLESLSPVAAREQVLANYRATNPVLEEVARIETIRIPSAGGEIPIRIYHPGTVGAAPGLVYFHGGGWVVCNLDTHDIPCAAIARRAGAVVVAVDYRLAPEHKYPAAVEDCYAAFQWVAGNAEALGIDAGRLSVAGDSAGGNLAAVVAIRSREENGPAIDAQVLVYPVTDLSSLDTPSYVEFAEGYQLTRAMMVWFREQYLAGTASADGRHRYASPLLADDLRGLPRALVITAECDPLRDEGERYARRLEEAWVATRCSRYEGMIHPFFTLSPWLPQAFEAYQEVAEFVRGGWGVRVSAGRD